VWQAPCATLEIGNPTPTNACSLGQFFLRQASLCAVLP
jgi:hypothetical protein